jgi:two-component system, NtrC family, sensor kinase
MKPMQTDNLKGNILVVDDTPANLHLLIDILSKQGYEVRPAPNGKFALSAARGLAPDLILLDIMMPELNGYEVCEKLKADDQTRDIPVIFVSAINEVMDKVKAFSVGGVDYITKPFQVEEVLARVEAHLAIRNLQKSLENKNQELSQTLEQLKATQEELIHSEKMAALGQLIAGVAHEINTPLGAISSSIRNLTNFFSEELEHLPQFFQQLSKEHQSDFLALMQKSVVQSASLSTREKRQYKKALQQQLKDQGFDEIESLTNTLANIGIYDEIEPFLPLLKAPDSEKVLKTAYTFASAQKSTKTIATATEKAAKIVFALKSYARYDSSGEKFTINIIEGIETVLTLYNNQIKQGIEVVKNYGELPFISCYPDELNQVWTNLVHNALQAMEYKGTLTIDAFRNDTNVLVKIADSGKGIPPEIMPKIFQPFFTTKPAGEGSGLGLDIVRKIIEKHQGKIEVSSIPGQTTFTVFLPIHLNEETNHA